MRPLLVSIVFVKPENIALLARASSQIPISGSPSSVREIRREEEEEIFGRTCLWVNTRRMVRCIGIRRLCFLTSFDFREVLSLLGTTPTTATPNPVGPLP